MKLGRFLSDRRVFAPEGGEGGGVPNEPSPAAVEPSAAEASSAASAAPDLSWIGEEYRGEAGLNLDAFRPHYEELLAEQARRAERDAEVPQDGTYDFALPETLDLSGLELPAGYTPEIRTDDPLFADLGALLSKHGLPKSAAPELVGLLARYEAQQTAALYKQSKEEAAKLGATPAQAQARLSQLQRTMQARLPADQAEALMGAATTYAGVLALERLLAPRGIGATVPQPAKPDLEGLRPFERLKRINATAQARS